MRGRSLYQPSSMLVPFGEPSLGSRSPLSPANNCVARPHCFRLFRHTVACAARLARLSAGSNRLARMPITAITTNNSINVNPRLLFINVNLHLSIDATHTLPHDELHYIFLRGCQSGRFNSSVHRYGAP